MTEILPEIIPLLKEFIMEYGLWETVTAITVSITVIVIAWRLPNIITALKGNKNG